METLTRLSGTILLGYDANGAEFALRKCLIWAGRRPAGGELKTPSIRGPSERAWGQRLFFVADAQPRGRQRGGLRALLDQGCRIVWHPNLHRTGVRCHGQITLLGLRCTGPINPPSSRPIRAFSSSGRCRGRWPTHVFCLV